MKYAQSTGGFYNPAIHGDNIPADAVNITSEEHAALLQGQSAGKCIVADANGKPILVAPAEPTFAEKSAVLVKQIDADADSIYAAALGNRATEYAEAEAQAQVYKDAGYVGDAPDYVQSWADAAGLTTQAAADDILATAAAWRTAQEAIRANRLSCKQAAKAAATSEALAAVAATWSAFVVAIKALLGQ
jgi:hypothetical protein